MDFIRQLLLDIEGGRRSFEIVSARHTEMTGRPSEDGLSDEDAAKLAHHLDFLEKRGLVDVQAKLLGGVVLVKGLTWEGHEFLASVRDADIWKRTKELAKNGGSEALGAVWDIAKAVGKEQLKRRTGLEF